MYCKFFGFSEKPFDVTPDPKFLYLSPGHRETLATLIYGINERRGFITIVGEVGTGKTMLLNTVLGRLDEKTRVANIFHSDTTFDQMLTMTLVDLELTKPEERLHKTEALLRLREFAIQQLSRGGNVVLLVDEAQNFDCSELESLRLLSNLESRKYKLIQIVLSGQPELDVKLSQPELRQLTQRISLKRYIMPLSEEETYEYIRHRLSMADYKGRALFSRQARKVIWEYSGGVPRKINILCDNAFLIAYAVGQKRIEANVIQEAIKDLSWSPFSGSREDRAETPVQPTPRSRGKTSYLRFATGASLALVACFIFLVGFLLGMPQLKLQERGLLPVWTSIRAKTLIQQADPEGSRDPDGQPVSHEQSVITQEVALATLLEEPESGHGMVREPPGGHRPLGELAVIENQGQEASLVPSSRETGESLTRQPRGVVVKRGDNLFRIVLQAHGRYDKSILSTVLRENPEIQSPDRIMVGQVIKLPLGILKP